MKRVALCVVAALVVVLTVGVMAGCSSQSTSTAEQSQDEIIAELKDAISNPPTYKSVTVTEVTESTFENDEAESDGSSTSAANSEASTEPDVIEATTVYKFDASGDKLKTSMTAEIGDITLQYFSDGEEAVCVTDGPVYSGTTEQFDMTHFAGVEAYLENTIGDLNTLVDCIDTVTKEQQEDMTVYTLNLDPQKYIDSDETLSILADYGSPVLSAVVTLGFDQEGRIVLADEMTEYELSSNRTTVTLADFDSTVIEPMPEADKTFDEMNADMEAKLDELAEAL